MNANFEMGPRWIFFTDGQFLTISRKITYARFAMAEIERGRERGNYLVREKFLREKLGDFFWILSLFLYEMFSCPKSFIPDEELSLTKLLSDKNFF